MSSARKLMLLIGLSLLVVLAGCSGEPGLPGGTTPVADLPTLAPTAPSNTGQAETPAQVVTNTDNGKTVTLKVGQVVSIQLRDRTWSPPVLDSTVLQALPQNAMPVQGLTRWDYKALAPGTTTLTTQGSCLEQIGQPNCLSILIYKVTITVTS